MHPTLSLLLAWLLALAGVLAWGGVGFLAYRIDSSVTALHEMRQTLAAEEARNTSAFKVRSALRETAAEREALQAAASDDILSVVERIESLGEIARADLVIGNAAPIESESESSVQAVSVTVRLEGSFARVVHALALLDTLPYAVVLDTLELEHSEQEASVWRASVRLRIFTTTPLPT